MFNCPYSNASFGPYSELLPSSIPCSPAALTASSSPTSLALSSIASRHGVYLVGGSIPERSADGRLYNTSLVLAPDGGFIAKHRKLHLFDIDVPGRQRFKESDTLTAGDAVTVFDTPWGRCGLGICYDIRFPEQAAAMVQQGAQLLVYPGAFNTTTGPLHWELLARARAVDCQAFVLVCSPARNPNSSYQAWGHSSVVNPWGKLLASCEHEQAVIVCDIDLAEVTDFRSSIPTSKQKRSDVYRLALSSSPAAQPSGSLPRLHLVTSAHDLTQDKLVAGLGENRPTQRKQLIFDQLRQHAEDVQVQLLTEPLPSPPSLELALLVHTADYVSFLCRAWAEWSELVREGKADLYMSAEMKRKGGDTSVFLPGQIAPRDHTNVVFGQSQSAAAAKTLSLLSRPGRSIHSQICYYALDRLTPIQSHTLTDLAHDLRVIEAAAALIPAPSASSPSPSAPVRVYALTTQPGHHASASTFGGYCYVNNAAVCCALLSRKGYRRVGLLDVDYHAGNGSMQIFYSTNRVLFASLHCEPDFDYPYNIGYSDQTGEGDGAGYTVNVPLPPRTDWAQYRLQLAAVIARMKAEQVDALVVSVGVDTVQGDPECSPLGGFVLQQPQYAELGAMIRDMQLHTVLVQEGGYKLDEVAKLVRNIVLPERAA